MSFEQVQECAAFIKERFNGDIPKMALVLGSGLNSMADAIDNPTIFSYLDLPRLSRTHRRRACRSYADWHT